MSRGVGAFGAPDVPGGAVCGEDGNAGGIAESNEVQVVDEVEEREHQEMRGNDLKVVFSPLNLAVDRVRKRESVYFADLGVGSNLTH